MGRLDILTKEYMKQPPVFADVFNQFLYHGRQVIAPEELAELDTAGTALPYGAGQASVPEQRYRDVAKMLLARTDGRAAYCILAAENEGKINYAMPVKDGLYDFLQLARQVAEAAASHRKEKPGDARPSGDEFLSGFWKGDRLLPVVTVVVYFGAETWDGPRSLREMYADCDEEILRHAADYRINLITPGGLSDEEINAFQSNMREIMLYIKYSKDKEQLARVVTGDQRFRNVERSAVEIINAATNSKLGIAEGKEPMDMCKAIQDMREESREEGRLEGRQEGRLEGRQEGRLEGRQEGRLEGRLEGRQEGRQEGKIEGILEGAITFARELGASVEEVEKSLMAKYGKSAKEAEELMRLYWK